MVRQRSVLRTTAFGLVFLCLPLIAAADRTVVDVTVTWAPNPPEDQIAGYVLCYGPISRSVPGFARYETELDVGAATEYAVALPADVPRWYFAVISYDAAGYESEYSPEYRWPAVREFSIAAAASAGGAVVPSGTIQVEEGALSPTFAFLPDRGYVIADVTVDGVSVGAVSSFSLGSVKADHTLAASFRPAAVPQEEDPVGAESGGSGGGGGCFLRALR